MKKGYLEEVDYKELAQNKIQIFKHKRLPFSAFLILIVLNLAFVGTCYVLFDTYKQTHPYSLDEISELTSTVYLIEYLEVNSDTTQDVDEIETYEDVIEEVDEISDSTTDDDTQILEDETTTAAQATTTTTTVATTTTTTNTTTVAAVLSSSLGSETVVYVTANGSKFHYATCSYLSSSMIGLTYGEALSKGYSACSRCFPNG